MPRPLAIHQGVSHLTVSEPELIALFTALDAWPAYALPPGELSIAFLSDDALAEVHRAFLDDPELTDVITFPGTSPEDHQPDACDTMGEEFREAGEICVSVDMAIRVAAQHGHSLSWELTLYLVHGWLHLAGLDDKSESSRAQMRRAEVAAFEWLESQEALPTFSLPESP